MAIEADAAATAAARAADSVSEMAPMSPPVSETASASAAGPARPRGWLRKLIPRGDYHVPRSSGRRWRLPAAPSAAGASRLASSLSRSLRWKRLPGLSFSLSLRSGSAAAVVDAVAFRVMYVVEAVVLGLALSCFFLCCGCHL